MIRIAPSRGWTGIGLGELWQYRDLLLFHTLKDIKSKYRQMALGPLWIVLQPLVNMLLFTFVFGTIAKLPSEGVPYPVFTLVALLPWTLFQNACTFSSGSLVQQMPVISKVYFPRLIIPIASTLSWVVDFFVSLVFLLALMLSYGYVPGSHVIFLPIFLIWTIAFALAIGLCTASLAVKYRDVQFVIAYGLRAFMYLTPVAYSGVLVPARWQWLYELNPLYWIIEGFRWALLGTSTGPTPALMLPAAMTVFLLILGTLLFRRAERSVVDTL